MKLNKASQGAIKPGNEQEVLADAKAKFDETSYITLVLLIAQMFDIIERGGDMYMIIGATSKKDAYTVTVKDAGTPTTFYGASLSELADKLEDAL